MKEALVVVLFRLLTLVVSEDAVESVSVSVLEGDSVTLMSGLTDIKTVQRIEWRVNGTRIDTFTDGRHLDDQTGDLKISNIRTTDSVPYKLSISSTGTSSKKEFNVKVVPDTEVKPVPVTVMKGDSVTLRADLTNIQTYGEIQWRFGEQTFPVPSLNITNITTQHTGLYEADITSSSRRYIIHKTFNVTISDEVVSVSVLEGDTVTLLTGLTEIQTDDQILWKSGDHEHIALLNGTVNKIWSNIDLNRQTGDLTIRNIQRGDYKVEVNTRRMISHRKYRINIVVSADEVKPVSAMKGDSVTLLTGLTDIQRDGEIQWRFEEQKSPVTVIANSTTVYDDVLNEKFRGRLNLDQTGSLTIIDTTTQHTGVYKVSINRGRYIIHKTFNMTVSGKDAVNAVLTKAGKSVNLQIDTKIHNHELIQWMFENTTRAKMNESVKQLFEGLEETFKKRLKLDQTGSLSITNIRTTDSGLYTWSCKSSRYTIYKTTFVYVVPDLSLGEAVGIALLLAVAVAVGFSVGMTVYRSGQNRQRVNGEKQIYQSTEDHDHEETELQ